ncbi:hypothetical protein D3C75_1174820 [compost metagenome]
MGRLHHLPACPIPHFLAGLPASAASPSRFGSRFSLAVQLQPDFILGIPVRDGIDGAEGYQHDKRNNDHVHQQKSVVQLIEHYAPTSST